MSIDKAAETRIGIVVLTYNRREELLRTLGKLAALDERVPVCVVDNASSDGSAEAVEAAFPQMQIVRLPRNLGAAGRNYGAYRIGTRYVAFCDDDTWWAPGSLARAADLLDACHDLGAITARVLVGPEEREDPTSASMAASPLPRLAAIQGTEVSGFLAGACVMRRRAFIEAGGYEPRFFIGGEEELLALDLMAAGWRMAYVPELVVHHHPSRLRDAPARRRLLLRNALWCAWLRRPVAGAARQTARRLVEARHDPRSLPAVVGALTGLPWVLRHRRVVPAHVESTLQLVERRGEPA